MTDHLKFRTAAIMLLLETGYDTQLSVERDPYGATKIIEDALYLIRDLVDVIERLQEQCEGLKKND